MACHDQGTAAHEVLEDPVNPHVRIIGLRVLLAFLTLVGAGGSRFSFALCMSLKIAL